MIEDGPPRSAGRGRSSSSTGSTSATRRPARRSAARAPATSRSRLATGEWLNFLDDDDVLFADHVEVLVDAVRRARSARAPTRSRGRRTPSSSTASSARYQEVMHVTRHRQPFDRLTLWHHNYLPIQAVLFHRRLYEKHGGFAEDMDQLEDWNLWTRYTLEDDFVLVEKTTSKYRVPADAREAADRQAHARQGLRGRARAAARAVDDALARARSPEMADTYVRSQAVVMVSADDLRRWLVTHPLPGAPGRMAPAGARIPAPPQGAANERPRVHGRALPAGRRPARSGSSTGTATTSRRRSRPASACSTWRAAKATARRCSRAARRTSPGRTYPRKPSPTRARRYAGAEEPRIRRRPLHAAAARRRQRRPGGELRDDRAHRRTRGLPRRGRARAGARGAPGACPRPTSWSTATSATTPTNSTCGNSTARNSPRCSPAASRTSRGTASETASIR